MTCPFCNPDPGSLVIASDSCYAKPDAFPVTPGHILVIPRRHVASFWELTAVERLCMTQVIESVRMLLDYYCRPDGYNLGVNIGEAAGQTVPHAHVHVIPRYRGDLHDPRGGVRGCIPHKRIY